MIKSFPLATASFVLALGTAAHAQTAAGDPSGGIRPRDQGLEEIVVTAQRRAENLQDVPIAVNAITAAQLTKLGVTGMLDLKVAVPTLNVTNTAGHLTSSLRGVGSNSFGQAIENPVALYVDGVYYAATNASILTLNNVAQVAVLKGPQGTLFGRNATGGLIQVTTLDPTEKPSGSYNIGYANYNTSFGNAYLSGALTDTLRADIAISASDQGDGWGVNLFNDQNVYRVDHDLAVRSKFVFEPNDLTSFTLIGDYANRRDSLQAYTGYPNTIPGYQLPGLPPLTLFPPLGYDIDTDIQPLVKREGGGVSLRWDQKIGTLNFMSLSAYRESRSHHDQIDYDGSSQPIVTLDVTEKDNQFSEELQLSSVSGGAFDWLVGAYYFRAVADYAPFLLFANDQGVNVTINGRQRTESIAGYAQGTYKVQDDTNLTLGLRYTTEERTAFDSYTDVFIIPLGLQLPRDDHPDASKRFNRLTYRLSLDHRFSDAVFAYASYNRGFKSGGYTMSSPGRPPYDPEDLDAFEVGLKTDLLAGNLRLNVAGFYYDYNDIQIQQIITGAVVVINGAGAHIYGADADLEFQMTREFRLTTGIGLVHSKFTSFRNCPVSTPAGGTPIDVAGTCDGNMLPLASKVSLNVGGSYAVQLGAGTLNLNGNVYYNSGFYPEADNAIEQGDYALIGASVTYDFGSGLSIGAFGRNLTDRRVVNFVTTAPNGNHTGYFQAPRTYGLTIGYEF